ncbi:MAG TPA: hypothetical protein VJM74_00365 [Nitrososphaeraceae archaeon]|nr:hypothetical protein [Nitrososphaeraceae archaeon]
MMEPEDHMPTAMNLLKISCQINYKKLKHWLVAWQAGLDNPPVNETKY